MEYMALGKPTVCFETTENVTTAGCSALYAHDNDVQDYARQIARLMDDSELRAKMGQCARERIQNGLTWAHQSQELLKLYRDLFQSKPSQLRV
jgi:glycosyltransferase involved in cell wall biosynthesis